MPTFLPPPPCPLPLSSLPLPPLSPPPSHTFIQSHLQSQLSITRNSFGVPHFMEVTRHLSPSVSLPLPPLSPSLPLALPLPLSPNHIYHTVKEGIAGQTYSRFITPSSPSLSSLLSLHSQSSNSTRITRVFIQLMIDR